MEEALRRNERIDVEIGEIIEKTDKKLRILGNVKENLEIIQNNLISKMGILNKENKITNVRTENFQKEIFKLEDVKKELEEKQIQLNEELIKLKESEQKNKEIIQNTLINYEDELNKKSITISENQAVINNEISNLSSLYEKLVEEKLMLQRSLIKKGNEEEVLLDSIKEINQEENKRIQKIKQFENLIEDLDEQFLNINFNFSQSISSVPKFLDLQSKIRLKPSFN